MNKKNIYGIRKMSMGVGSVLIGISFLFPIQTFADEVRSDMIETTVHSNETDSSESGLDETDEITGEVLVDDQVNKLNNASSNEDNLNSITSNNIDLSNEKIIDLDELQSEEISRDYYVTEKYKSNIVLEKNNLETTKSNSRIDISDELLAVNSLDGASIHIEFQPQKDSSSFYSLFSATSQSKRNEYFTIVVDNGVALVEGRDENGQQLYDSFKTSSAKVLSNE